MAEVDAADRQKARAAIADGVKAAQDQWLEARFIAEALALELMATAKRDASTAEVAAHLRALAEAIEVADRHKTRADIH